MEEHDILHVKRESVQKGTMAKDCLACYRRMTKTDDDMALR